MRWMADVGIGGWNEAFTQWDRWVDGRMDEGRTRGHVKREKTERGMAMRNVKRWMANNSELDEAGVFTQLLFHTLKREDRLVEKIYIKKVKHCQSSWQTFASTSASSNAT